MSAPDSAGPRLADVIRGQRRPLHRLLEQHPLAYVVERINALADRNPFEFEARFNDRIGSDGSWAVDDASWRWCACCAGRPVAVCRVMRPVSRGKRLISAGTREARGRWLGGSAVNLKVSLVEVV